MAGFGRCFDEDMETTALQLVLGEIEHCREMYQLNATLADADITEQEKIELASGRSANIQRKYRGAVEDAMVGLVNDWPDRGHLFIFVNLMEMVLNFLVAYNIPSTDASQFHIDVANLTALGDRVTRAYEDAKSYWADQR